MMSRSKIVIFFAAVAVFFSSTAALAVAPTAIIRIVSKTYGTGTPQVPWGLPVVFDASTSTDPEGGPLTFSWIFGDGKGASGGPTVIHQYTFAGLPAECVPVKTGGIGRIPPDLCPAVPNVIPVTLTVSNGEGLTHTTTLNLRLRRQERVPLADIERDHLMDAMAVARAVLNPNASAERNALKHLSEAEGSLFDAELEVLISAVAGGLANLKAAANEDERALKSFGKAIKELKSASSPGGVAQLRALTIALKETMDSLLRRVVSLDPCCDKKRRQAQENFVRGLGALGAGDLNAAADEFIEAYGKIKGSRLPLRIPAENADIPTPRSGAPLLETERAVIEVAVSDALVQLGASTNERSAARNLQDVAPSFGEARIAEVDSNFRQAAAEDERALKAVAKGINDLKGVNAAIQRDLIIAMRDVVGLALERGRLKVGLTSNVRQGLETYSSGLQNFNRGDFSAAASDFLKAYGKLKNAAVSP